MAGFPHNNTPSDKATYTISVDAPSVLANVSGVQGDAAVASNGELQSKTVLGERTTWVWRQDKQMASELVVIAIGRFEVIEGSVTLSDNLTEDLWQGWIHHSYERVIAGLPKAKRPQAPQARS